MFWKNSKGEIISKNGKIVDCNTCPCVNDECNVEIKKILKKAEEGKYEIVKYLPYTPGKAYFYRNIPNFSSMDNYNSSHLEWNDMICTSYIASAILYKDITSENPDRIYIHYCFYHLINNTYSDIDNFEIQIKRYPQHTYNDDDCLSLVENLVQLKYILRKRSDYDVAGHEEGSGSNRYYFMTTTNDEIQKYFTILWNDFIEHATNKIIEEAVELNSQNYTINVCYNPTIKFEYRWGEIDYRKSRFPNVVYGKIEYDGGWELIIYYLYNPSQFIGLLDYYDYCYYSDATIRCAMNADLYASYLDDGNISSVDVICDGGE